MNSRIVIGIVLLLSGGLLFASRGQTFDPGTLIGYFWPSLFVIPLGLMFHWMYFSLLGRRGSGVLIPGGILLTVGLVCQISMLFDIWHYMWPGFILAVAVGLFEFYWFGYRNKWLLLPINILAGLSLMFFALFSVGSIFNQFSGQPIVAILFILAGGFLLIRWKKKDTRDEELL